MFSKIMFIFFLLLGISEVSFADYIGNLFDPITGHLLYLRVYFPTDQLCVQVNSANHICWSTIPAIGSLLLEDGSFLLLEDGGHLLLEQ